MPTGKEFRLTDKRRRDIISMLKKQWTVSGIAVQYGISHKTLSRLLKKEGIDVKAVKMSGLYALKAKTYEAIDEIDEADKRVNAGLSFLKQYPIPEDNTGSDTATVNIDIAVNKVMEDLNQ